VFFLAKKILFKLDAERAHNLTLNALYLAANVGLLSKRAYSSPGQIELAGLQFPNRVGLAGGMDKNGLLLDYWAHFGFGFAEIGTVTPKPQEGNPKPRMFRLIEDESIINRMGFNNKGLAYVALRFKQRHQTGFILGANLGKNKTTENEVAESDYCMGMERLYEHADYFTINISSPNTPGLRDLQKPARIKTLLNTLVLYRNDLPIRRPLFVKIDPDLSDSDLFSTLESVSAANIDGVIATNTTLSRPNSLKSINSAEAGGLSGAPLFEQSLDRVRKIRNFYGPSFPLMGVGGIDSVKRGQAMLEAGADTIQIYSGFVFKGPNLIKEMALSLPLNGND
jgi:dihydroorotate dehydrogenase